MDHWIPVGHRPFPNAQEKPGTVDGDDHVRCEGPDGLVQIRAKPKQAGDLPCDLDESQGGCVLGTTDGLHADAPHLGAGQAGDDECPTALQVGNQRGPKAVAARFSSTDEQSQGTRLPSIP
jgi:hypothetical protein